MIKRQNISKAIDKAAKLKKKRNYVRKVLRNKDKYIDRLIEMFKEHSYQPGNYKQRVIQDGSRKKKRIIEVPRFI